MWGIGAVSILLLASQNGLHFAAAAPLFTPILPPAYPLAVKNPYLSGMLPFSYPKTLDVWLTSVC